MPDVFTKMKRSEVMARIRSRGNKETELALVKLLRQHHLTGWRRHLQISAPPTTRPHRPSNPKSTIPHPS